MTARPTERGAAVPRGDAGFTYRVDIAARPEQVWRGLTDPALTMRYWRHPRAGGKEFPSEWTTGSTYDFAHPEVGLLIRDPQQVVLESDPFRRLAYTWHSFTPEWARCVGLPDARAAAWRAEPRSKAAFEIAPAGPGVVSLTVVHDGFAPGSEVLGAVSEGWPAVLSSLKTLLETGSALQEA